jgi:hypothetical protein
MKQRGSLVLSSEELIWLVFNGHGFRAWTGAAFLRFRLGR